MKRYWRALQKKEKKADKETRERTQRDSDFITNLMQTFLHVLSSIPKEGFYNIIVLNNIVCISLA